MKAQKILKNKNINLSDTCPSGLPGQVLILTRPVTFHFEKAHSPLCALKKVIYMKNILNILNLILMFT